MMKTTKTRRARFKPTRRGAVLAAGLLLAGTAALAGEGSSASGASGGRNGPPPGPPPEAIAACQGKAVGASASFTGRHGETFSGSCQYVTSSQSGSTSQVLALRPDRMPPPPAQGGGAGSGSSN